MAKCNEPLNKSRNTLKESSQNKNKMMQQIMDLIILVLLKSNPCLSGSQYISPIFMTRARGLYNKIKTTQLAGSSIGHGSEEAPCLDRLLAAAGEREILWSLMKIRYEILGEIFLCYFLSMHKMRQRLSGSEHNTFPGIATLSKAPGFEYSSSADQKF